MKRCPECEFLYEDEQDRCDMDGTRLSFTATLPALPTPPEAVAAPKSRWAAFTVPVLAVIVLASVLFILYRSAPRGVNSPSYAQPKPASQKALDKDLNLPGPGASQPAASGPASSPRSSEPSRDPFAAPNAEPEKTEKPAPAGNQKNSSPLPVSHTQEAPASQPDNSAGTESKPSSRVTPISPVPPGPRPAATYSAKSSATAANGAHTSAPQNANKDSKVNSFLKKAGKILKKPF